MNTALTAEEKCRLRKWIADGNDPADNPWLMSGVDGRPLDFITAWRDMLSLEAEHMVGL
ncbi:hypothetical protein SDC9_193797 [bioreactor metagenome]|jgi:hypothetical protein|uniref:Uncharacterized protein n=1 Tax=bioreactor metagenome TaxID=1076179 RepID=A0A645ID48_9ZZZZ|nr:hypothetical protein [Oscillospiraceae bacterium]